MPFRLKETLVRHGIAKATICEATLQTGGRPMSRTAMSLLVNYGYFPKGTPEDRVRQQIEAFLVARGIPAAERAAIWEHIEGEESSRTVQPMGAVIRSLNSRSPYQPLPQPTKAVKTAPEFEPMETEMLSPAAKRQFKLSRDPFQDDINGTDDVYLSEDQRYILEAMIQTAKAGGITAVIGESGSGKTTLRKLLQHKIAREGQNIRLIFPHTIDKTKMSTGAICTSIVKDLEPETTVKNSLEGQARQVKEVLVRSSRAGAKHLLMIEEAHDLSIQTLKYLKRFHEIETDDGFGKVLSIVLIAQPEMRIKLDVARYPAAREFINRCEIATLSPLFDNLKSYIEHKFERAGVKAESVFSEDAYDAIKARWTKIDPATRAMKNSLYPLIVNNTVTHAMNRAAELGVPIITGDLIKEL